MTETALRRDLDLVRQRLLAAISGVGEDQFKRRPPKLASGDQPWSIAEILAHLLYTEQIWAGRFRAALAQDGVEVDAVPQEERDAAARSGRAAPVPQLLHGLLASRREIEMLLTEAEAAEDGLRRALVHPQLGRLTIGTMIEKFVIGHEAEHAAEIEALRDALSTSQAGHS